MTQAERESEIKQMTIAALDEAIQIIREKGIRPAKFLKVTRSAMSQWRKQGREIPPQRCVQLHNLTDGKVSLQRLNPRVFGVPEEEATA